jgi:serine/threonine protein kinase/WD40 repeat protein
VIAATRLGPYEVLSQLGVGGMGEVYRARDTRLGRDVAVKVLPAQFASDPGRLRRFEQEARAVAALSHPNIVALYDVGTHEGSPFIVSELLEGETLRDRLKSGRLTVRKAVETGVQIAQGLAAAHEKGIVHRDLKPANVFLTRDGHVKILDFGIAKLTRPDPGPQATTLTPEPSTETGGILGTVGYMSPEQVRGLPTDHRTDIFSFGCVLYEMLSGRSPFRKETTAETMTAILHEDPPALTGIGSGIPKALQGIVTRCLEKQREDRFSSARDLGFALQAVVEAVPREIVRKPEEARPYPGLAAFTEADAEDFFGREEEIAPLWRKIPDRDLLALIGPSGAGKTSFLRAGMIPHAPPGWRCLIATPGHAPFASLARALVPQFAGDTEGTSQLFQIHEPDVAVRVVERWRLHCDHALVIVDQFEELFTLNGAEAQAQFAELLGRIATLDGVHVVLSMRDDFFFRCHEFSPLAAVFQDVTPLGPPSSGGLRRAVVEPAARLGFAFEDDGLAQEMVQAVEGERGALPLLAFAVARLWEERDREHHLLTRGAYESLGGVAGALALHAEATLEKIGEASVPIVRELFRNLTTSQQTRCAVDAEELVSVFPDSQPSDARNVLRQLVDARLLTSFEVETPDGIRHHRIEIVHESLLTAWPRLVRWQAQDAEGALLRDQLRQAAHLWEEKGKPDDLLWTGTSFREYRLWREHYPGGLTAIEEGFGNAMVHLAGRRRRRRRTAYAAILAVVVLSAVGLGVMWRKSMRETRRAEAEAAQREAAQLLALGRLRLADHPMDALAYAIASLERADNEPARRFAVEALWQGPPAIVLADPRARTYSSAWSPDDEWLALGSETGLALVRRETGAVRQLSSAYETVLGFMSDSQRLVTKDRTVGPRTVLHLWSCEEGRIERTMSFEWPSWDMLANDRLVTFTGDGSQPLPHRPRLVRHLSLDGKTQEVLGRWEPRGLSGLDLDPSSRWLFSVESGRLLQQRLDALSDPPRALAAQEGDADVWMQPWRDRVVTGDSRGGVRIRDVASGRLERELKSPADARMIGLDPTGRFLASAPEGIHPPRSEFLFDLDAPRTAEPTPLLGVVEGQVINALRFSPDGKWLGSFYGDTAALWNLTNPRSVVLGREKPAGITVGFTRDGHLLSSSDQGVLRRWALSPKANEGTQELWSLPGAWGSGVLELDPQGRFAVRVSTFEGSVIVVPLDGSPPSTYILKRPPGVRLWAESASLDPAGGLLAVYAGSPENPKLNSVRILDLATGSERTLDTRPAGGEGCEWPEESGLGTVSEGMAVPLWLPDGRLVTDGVAGLRVWDLGAGTSRLVRPCEKAWVQGLLASPDSGTVLGLKAPDEMATRSSLSTFDLGSGKTNEITSHGNQAFCFALDPSGRVLVTGDNNGIVRVGPLSGAEPHLLFGHTGQVTSVAVSPDGRTIASASDDGTIRLWPMPDLSKPPLHALPHDELLAKLRSLTNLRAVRDPSSDTGWRIEVGPFPGWATVPEWQP